MRAQFRRGIERRVGLVLLSALVFVFACEPTPAPPPPFVPKVEPAAELQANGRKPAHARVSEREKIRRVIDALRHSGAVVIRNGVEYDANAGAEHLEMKVSYAGAKLQTAEQFIVHIATRSSMSGKPYLIRTLDGTEQLAGDWFYARLAELRPPPTSTAAAPGAVTPAAPAPTPVADPITRALDLISLSDAEFVAPRPGKSDKVYDGPGFSRMLRTKTKWLGEGLDRYPSWREEIATRSFSSFQEYRVQHRDGRVESLTSWLSAVTSRDAKLQKQNAARLPQHDKPPPTQGPL